MARQQGLYTLIQYGAIPERQEFVNIGVLVIVPANGEVAVRFADTSARLRRIFGDLDEGRLDDMKVAFSDHVHANADRLTDPDQLTRFIQMRANALRLTALRPIMVTSLEGALAQLIANLVADPGGQGEQVRHSPILLRVG